MTARKSRTHQRPSQSHAGLRRRASGRASSIDEMSLNISSKLSLFQRVAFSIARPARSQPHSAPPMPVGAAVLGPPCAGADRPAHGKPANRKLANPGLTSGSLRPGDQPSGRFEYGSHPHWKRGGLRVHISRMETTVVQCRCGAEYKRVEPMCLMPHSGHVSCEVCGAVLESWAEDTHVATFELVKRPDGKPA